MWEKVKERGYGLATLGVLGSNLAIFIMVITKGGYVILVEPWEWMLYTETVLCALLFLWGIERLIKDMRG